VFAAADVAVTIANSSGVETPLVLNTDYSVTLNGNQDTSPGGTITYPISGAALPSGSKLSIVGDIDYDQPLDLPSGGNFSPIALENQLDRATMQIQQLAEGLSRAAKLPVTNSEDPATLVADIVRLADSADNIDTLVANLADITTVADDLNEPVSEINTVAVNIANVNAVGSNIANVNTVAGISANVTTVAAIDDDVTAVAGVAANVTTVAGVSAAVTAVAAIDDDVTIAAANVADITNFADVYQGPKTSDPALRNDGSALQVGDLYFNTTNDEMRVYGGTLWKSGFVGTVAVQNFSGNGSTTAFTLTTAPGGENNTQIFIGGVYQQKDQYSVSGTTLTFSTAPPSGTNNVEVVTISTLAIGETDASLVSFVQAGPGAVERTAQAKLREFVSVKDFGAVGDGVTDDTAAIQLALNHIHMYGGNLYIPLGNFKITLGLTFAADTAVGPLQITGAGAASIITMSGVSGFTGLTISGTTGVTRAYLTLKDFRITSSTTAASTAAILLSGIADYQTHDLVVDGNLTKGIYLYGAQQGEISGGYVSAATGIHFALGAGSIASNGCDLHGVSFNGGGTVSASILIDGSDSCFIRGNHFTGGTGIIVNSTGFGMVAITDNHVEATNNVSGIIVNAGTAIITGNMAVAGVGAFPDVSIVAGDFCVVSHNYMTRNGLSVGASSNRTTVLGNRLAALTNAGTNTNSLYNYNSSGGAPIGAVGNVNGDMNLAGTLTATNYVVGRNFISTAAPVVIGSAGVAYGGTISTTANAGGAGAPPAAVSGYININVSGVNRKIPFYQV
jgi:hypothetical protein